MLTFNFVQELRWPGAMPLTGLQFERKDLLFRGDRLTIRATSDLQTVFRRGPGPGRVRDRSRCVVIAGLAFRTRGWFGQLGESRRTSFSGQFSAGMDRRAASQSSTVDLQVLRCALATMRDAGRGLVGSPISTAGRFPAGRGPRGFAPRPGVRAERGADGRDGAACACW